MPGEITLSNTITHGSQFSAPHGKDTARQVPSLEKQQKDIIPPAGYRIRQIHESTVTIDDSTAFNYLIRKDGKYTVGPIAREFAQTHLRDTRETEQVFLRAYDTFFARVTESLAKGFAHKDETKPVEIHLFSHDDLDKRARAKADGHAMVSFDPLTEHGVHTFGVSRGYFHAGQTDFGHVPRPGYPDLDTQAQAIATETQEQKVAIVEDDMFSGGSAIRGIKRLQQNGVNVTTFIPAIKVGDSNVVEAMGVTVDPVVTYTASAGVDIFEKVDLGDPRDFLMGGSGLVTKLFNGKLGRAPYTLPYVSPSARAGIAESSQRNFSLEVLRANLEFHRSIQEETGQELYVKDMEPYFGVFMAEGYGIPGDAPMMDVIKWSMDNIDSLWEATQRTGAVQEAFSHDSSVQ